MSVLVPAAFAGQVDAYLSGTSHETTTPDAAGLTAATSRCEISSDPTYGTKENPIRLGGRDHPATREISYFSALRGPAGQGLHFRREGNTSAGGSILDLYIVDYPGISEPRRLYVDGYHMSPPQAPTGWLCAAPILGVEPPAVDPLSRSLLMALAVKLGEGELKPISLDPDGSAKHGVVFDHVRLVASASRAARDRGVPLDASALPPDVTRPRSLIIAYPTECGGKDVAPESIVYSAGGRAVPPVATAREERIGDLVPGFRAPAGALAVRYDVPWLFDNAQISVKYPVPCDRERGQRTFVAEPVDGGFEKQSIGIAPPGAPLPPEGAAVIVQVYFDASGVPMFPLYVMGPWELKDAAMDAALKWRLKPARINRAPIFDFVTMMIRFPKP